MNAFVSILQLCWLFVELGSVVSLRPGASCQLRAATALESFDTRLLEVAADGSIATLLGDPLGRMAASRSKVAGFRAF